MKISRAKFSRITGLSLVGTALIMGIMALFVTGPLFGQDAHSDSLTPEMASVKQWGFVAAAIAFGCGAIGAGIAISSVGAAAMGALSEKPELAGQALIFIALAEGLVIFGFITALMILGRV